MRFVLRDDRGRRLYIPWGCDGTGCPQYAADPGNPAFRRAWISDAARKLRAGYRGLYVDDASLAMLTSDASGDRQTPMDPRTGRPMRSRDWRRYVVEFLEQIRSAFPEAELHAFEDGGLTGGNGPVSFRAFLRHIDAVHRMGRRVVFDGSGTSPAGRELLLSGYLMANEGGDLLSSEERTEPGELWSGFRLNLGRARGDRERWRGVWRRDFAGGTVLLSDPGSSPGRLPIRGRRISGDRVTSIVLGDREGAIVLR
jgi:hypothetical protein